MLHILLDMLFPKVSLQGDIGSWITSREKQYLQPKPLTFDAIMLRESGIHYIDRMVAAASYKQSPMLRALLYRLKYDRVPMVAAELSPMLRRAAEDIIAYPDMVLCPVPLHWTRKLWRGFNQSEFLARMVAAECGWPIEHVLRRTRPTGHQAWRQRNERHDAVVDAFTPLYKRLPPHVVLIDDICTSGATLDACAKALKDHGVVSVQAIVLARG